MRRVFVYPDHQAVADAAGARLGLLLSDTVATQGRADVVLTGGTVGIELLRSLAASALSGLIDWTSVHVWWGDERFVPAHDADRNSLQAADALLRHVPLPEENIHRMGSTGVYSTAEDAAAAYSREMADYGNPAWDVALFGLGPDGHVASLFPGHDSFLDGRNGADVRAVHNSPKPPPTRVSLSLPAINRAKRVWVVATGYAKADVVARCIAGDPDLPGAAVHGIQETLWLIDAEASTKV